jgi:hypothetical protein
MPYLRVSLNWVRLRQALAAQAHEGIDIEGVVQETERIRAALKNLKEVRRQLTSIDRSRESITDFLAELEKGVLTGIEGILTRVEDTKKIE